MFIIPVGNRVDWKRPPLITLALILINCFVFFILQSGSDQKDEKAAQFYFKSDLPKWELDRFADYLDKNGRVFELRQLKDDIAQHNPEALFIMEGNGKFMRELRAGHIITPQEPEYAAWKSLRSQYQSMRSFTTRFVFYVGDPSPFNAFTAAFMHADFFHLFGNMVVLFLVGFLVESVIGRSLFALAYFISIYTSIAMYMLTAHGGALLGASGAIAGVMGLYTVIFGLRKIDFFYSIFFYFDYVRAPAIILLPLWLGNELYQFMSEKGAHIAFMAHFGGLLGGAIIGVLYRKWRPVMIEARHEEAESHEMDDKEFQRGMSLLTAMEFQKALAVFKPLLEKHPDDMNLVRLVYRAAKPNPASEEYHRAALKLLAASGMDEITQHQTHTIFREYMSCAKPAPKLGRDLVAKLAKRFAVAGQCEDAAKLVEYLRRNTPNHAELPTIMLALANGYYRTQRKDQFVTTLNALIELFPQSGEARMATDLLRTA